MEIPVQQKCCISESVKNSEGSFRPLSRVPLEVNHVNETFVKTTIQ